MQVFRRILCTSLILLPVLSLHAQTFTLRSILWSQSNPIDQDDDGKTRYRKLIIDADVPVGQYTLYAKVYVKFAAQQNYTLYVTTGTFIITGSTDNDFIGVDVGAPNVQLVDGTYDFKVELYRQGDGSVKASRSADNEPALNDQLFETNAQDPAITYTFRSLKWVGGRDQDGDGYYTGEIPEIDIDVSQGTHRINVRYFIREGNWEYRLLDGSYSFLITGNSTQDKFQLGPGLNRVFSRYSFMIEIIQESVVGDSKGVLILLPEDIPLLRDRKSESESQETKSIRISSAYWDESKRDVDRDSYQTASYLQADIYQYGQPCQVTCYYKKSTETNWTQYAPPFTGEIGWPAMNPRYEVGGNKPELPHGEYDFKIEVVNTSDPSYKTVLDGSSDSDLAKQKFELSWEDGAVPPPSVAVTFEVRIPSNTPANAVVHIYGSWSDWKQQVAMSKFDSAGITLWRKTINFDRCCYPFYYKYTLGTANTVETGNYGEETDNREHFLGSRPHTQHDIVASWAALPVVIEPGWQTQHANTSAKLLTVKALSEHVAWTSGTDHMVLLTSDGGRSWQFTGNLPAGITIWNMAAVDENLALAAATTVDFVTGYIFRTSDGGATWQTVWQKASGFINDITMFDNRKGIALGDPSNGKWTILQTSDGGASWQPIANPPVAPANVYGIANGVDWRTDQLGWFGSYSSSAYQTSNGGTSWTPVTVTGLRWVTTLDFNSKGVGLAAGENKLVRTLDNGVSWQPLTSPAGTNTISCLHACGNLFWLTSGNDIFLSSDDGSTWKKEITLSSRINHLSIRRYGSRFMGWAVGNNGGIWKYDKDIPTSVEIRPLVRVQDFGLEQNYPNPFNASTRVCFDLPTPAEVTLAVYDLLGRIRMQLQKQDFQAGRHEIILNVSDLPSGAYFYQLTAQFPDGRLNRESRKMLMLR